MKRELTGTPPPDAPLFPSSPPPLTEVSKLWLPQNTRANGSDVPEMSRGARSLGTDEDRSGEPQDPQGPKPKLDLGK